MLNVCVFSKVVKITLQGKHNILHNFTIYIYIILSWQWYNMNYFGILHHIYLYCCIVYLPLHSISKVWTIHHYIHIKNKSYTHNKQNVQFSIIKIQCQKHIIANSCIYIYIYHLRIYLYHFRVHKYPPYIFP